MVKCNQFPGELLNLELLKSRLICFGSVKFRTNVHEMQIVGHEYLHIQLMTTCKPCKSGPMISTEVPQGNIRATNGSTKVHIIAGQDGFGNPSKMTRR